MYRRSGNFCRYFFFAGCVSGENKTREKFSAYNARSIFRHASKIKHANISSAKKNTCENFPIYGITTVLTVLKFSGVHSSEGLALLGAHSQH